MQHYIIPNCALISHLRRYNYEVRGLNAIWYSVTPDVKHGVTMLGSLPIAMYGTSIFALSNLDDLALIVSYYKSNTKHLYSNIEHFVEIYSLIREAISLAESGSSVRNALIEALSYISREISSLMYVPTETSFKPITDYKAEPPLLNGPKMIDLDYALPIYHSLSDLPVKIHVDYTELDEKLAEAGKRIARRFDIPEQEIAPVDTTPGREYVEKARNFRDIPGYANVPDLAAAATNMLTCYNNAAYEDFRTAADQIEEMINEIGYTVVRGFDDTDPARIVKTL